MLVDPGIVARFGAVRADAAEARSRILIERPALRAHIPGRRLGTVERPLALANIEAAEIAAAERHPDYPLRVDVAAARTEARLRNCEELRQLRLWIEAHDAGFPGEHIDRVPDRAV